MKNLNEFIRKNYSQVVFFLFFSFYTAELSATNYYVDVLGGLDANTGLSSTAAWQTLSKINSITFLPGDSILFKRGQVWSGTMNITESGNTANRIVFAAYGTGSRPIIDGGSLNETVVLIKSDYITLSGIEIKGGIFSCIVVSKSDYFIIDNCNIGFGADFGCGIQVTAKYGSGTRTGSNYGIIKNSQFDSGLRGNVGDKGGSDGIMLIDGANNWDIHHNSLLGWAHTAITAKHSSSTFETAYNKIHHNDIDGNLVNYNRAFEFYGENNKSHHNEFYQNYIHGVTITSHVDGNHNSVYYNVFDTIRNPGNDSNAEAYAMDLTVFKNNITNSENMVCHHNKIYNNVIFNSALIGIKIVGSVNGADSIIYANEITNNIFYNCLAGVAILNLSGADQFDPGANIYRNNLIYNSSITNIVHYRGGFTNVAGFNAFNGSNGDIISNNIQINPMFANTSLSNFNLSSGSPAINTGVNVGLTFDYDGNFVPQGSAPEMGAFEFGTPTSIEELILGKDIIVYPNPAIENLIVRYDLKESSDIYISVKNILGEEVISIPKESLHPGKHEQLIDITELRSGIYFCVLSDGRKILSSTKLAIY